MTGRAGAFLSRWLVFAGAVAAWQLAATAAGSIYFPPPSKIVVAAGQTWFSGPASRLFTTDTFVGDVLPSLGRVLGGFAIAAILGVGIGAALGRSRHGMDYAGPLLAFARSVPPPALVPVFMVLFHIGPGMQLATIVFGSVWPVLLNAVDGVRSVDATKRETARSLRTPRHYWIGMVVLPAALPKVFAGLRLSLSIALILMVISELVGAPGGIGYGLIYAQRQFEFPTMWASIALLGVLGYGLNAALLAVEHRALAWQPGRATTQVGG